MPSHFHDTAIVDAKAQLGERVQVGPYAIIEAGAVLGDDCALEAHSIVKGSARLGNGGGWPFFSDWRQPTAFIF